MYALMSSFQQCYSIIQLIDTWGCHMVVLRYTGQCVGHPGTSNDIPAARIPKKQHKLRSLCQIVFSKSNFAKYPLLVFCQVSRVVCICKICTRILSFGIKRLTLADVTVTTFLSLFDPFVACWQAEKFFNPQKVTKRQGLQFPKNFGFGMPLRAAAQ